MTTPDENKNVSSTPIVDPFPKPNTIPSGWDVSGFKTDSRPASDEGSPEKGNTENRNREMK